MLKPVTGFQQVLWPRGGFTGAVPELSGSDRLHAQWFTVTPPHSP